MATLRISYSQAGQTGKLLAQAVNAQVEALQGLRRVKSIMDRATWGDDWAALAVELGLPSTQAGADAAQAAWTIVSTALGAVDVPAVSTELERLDQG